jgi:capsule biosynthesis phosphatase
MKRWCVDIDNTLCEEKPKGTHWEEYANVEPIKDIVDFINSRYDAGDYIILSTARHMATTGANVGLVNARVGKITYDWLDKHGVKYHEIYFQKPYADYYLDDKALSVNELREILFDNEDITQVL